MKPESARRAGMAGFAVAPVAGRPSDAALIELGKQLEAAWAKERAASAEERAAAGEIWSEEEYEELAYRSRRIVLRIIRINAKTIEGLKVKARALSWCYWGEFDGFADSVTAATTDFLIGDSILFDLIALAAVDVGARS